MIYPQNSNPSITAVVLSANTDFGRCPLASKIPPALWPIEDVPAIYRVLKCLSNISIQNAVICCNGHKIIFEEEIDNIESMKLFFLEEHMPFGTAGCLREAVNLSNDEVFLIVPSQIINMPDLSNAIFAHRENHSALTIVKNFDSKFNSHIYIANRDIAQLIPAKGYFDIKENLIPAMIKQNMKVRVEISSEPIYSFRNHQQYLEGMYKYLDDCKLKCKNNTIPFSTSISDNVKLLGPTVILNNCSIDRNVLILGPSLIGNDVKIGENSIIEQSILWKGTNVRKNCFVRNCITDYNSIISSNSVISNKAVVQNNISLYSNIDLPIGKFAAIIAIILSFLWTYSSVIKGLINLWHENDDYSAGILVPFLTAAAFWLKRNNVLKNTDSSIFIGIAIFLFSQVIRFFGLYFMYSSAERLSMIFCIWSIIIIVWGWKLFYRNLPIFLFLILMFPPPHIIHNSIMLPLQKIATSGAAFCLEILGYAVNRHGNIIYVDNMPVAVVEACNGLRMIMAFLIITVFISLIIQKNRFEKLSLLVSSLPIAFICNIVRLTLTAITFTIFIEHKWTTVIHEFSGYAMIPMAIGLVMLEIKFMNTFTINHDDRR